MQLTYHGTNSLIINKDNSTIMIDPHFTRPGLLSLMTKIQPNGKKIKKGLESADIEQLDAVLLTHTHYDHALDAPEVIRAKGGVLFGSGSAVNLAKWAGLSEAQYQQVTLGRSYSIGNFSVRFHPAQHIAFPPPLSWVMPETREILKSITPPAWFWEYQSGNVFAIQVDRMLIFGSAGFTPGAYRDLDIETVVLSIGGLETRSYAYTEKLYYETVLAVGAKRVLISHWDNFFHPLHKKIRPIGLSRRTLSRIKNLGNRNGQIVHLLSTEERIRL